VTLRLPPGKSARPWLVRRLAVAERAAELLDLKRVALQREEAALVGRAAHARSALAEALGDAQRWWDRAAVVGGRRGTRLAAGLIPPAAVHVTWSTRLAVTRPQAAITVAGAVTAQVGAGGSALGQAAHGYGESLKLAAEAAALEEAHRRVAAELARTTRRLRAIEWRWVPQHERALAALDLALEEAERADGARVRWAVRRRDERAAPGR